MCILYAGIYRVALRLQRQAEAKHRAARAALLPYWSISRIRRTAPVWTILVATFPAVKTRSEAKHQRRAAMLMSAAGGAVGKVAVEVTHPVGGCRHFRFRSVEVTHQQQQQGTTLAAVVAADQHNSTQQQNDGVAVGGGGGGGEGTANNVADVQSPPPPVVSPTPNRKKERRRPHDKRSKKRHQQHDHHDDDDDSSSLAFSSDSEPGDVDHRRGSGRAPAAVAAVPAPSSKAPGRTSKKTRRRATRHTSPVVAVERAVQFIAEQRRTAAADDIRRPEAEMLTSMCSVSDCLARQQPSGVAATSSVGPAHGGCGGFAVEAPVSRCQLDHQCVFEAWRRPLPRLSPVWVRRQAGGACRQRGVGSGGGGCDDGRVDVVGSTSATHVVVVEEQDRCNLLTYMMSKLKMQRRLRGAQRMLKLCHNCGDGR